MARSRKRESLSSIQAVIAECKARGEVLPNDGSALLLGDILELAGLSRNHLARYPEVREALAEYAAHLGLSVSREGAVREDEKTQAKRTDDNMVDARLLREALRRIAALEIRCAELRAENVRLRASKIRDPQTAELIVAGGRISSR